MEPFVIEEVVKQLGGDQQAAYRAYQALEEIVTRAGAPGNDEERAAAAGALAAQLAAMTEPEKDDQGKEKPRKPLHSPAIRNKVARLLSYVGGAKEVPALMQALGDLDVREMARFALERNGSAEATDALIEALDQVGPRFRCGVVNTLGKRPGGKVLARLREATEDEDRQVRIAAVEALSRFADAANDAFMAKAARADCARCRARANRARVRLAETLGKAGDKSAAKRIYNAIRRSDADGPQKKSAERALKTMG